MVREREKKIVDERRPCENVFGLYEIGKKGKREKKESWIKNIEKRRERDDACVKKKETKNKNFNKQTFRWIKATKEL